MKIQSAAAISLASLLAVSLSGTSLAGAKQAAPAPGTAARAADAGVGTVAIPMDPLPILEAVIRTGHADPSMRMHATVSLPYADSEAMERFAERVSDPSSPDFRAFITPEEVGARFGLPAERVQAVADWLAGQGLTVTLVA